jgi:methyl-accepting chemotaxis protein
VAALRAARASSGGAVDSAMKLQTRLQLLALLPIGLSILLCAGITGFLFSVMDPALRSDTTSFVVVTFGVGALVIAGLFYAVSRYMLLRIGKLAQAAHDVKTGKLKAVDSDEGSDELTEISGAFNQMVTKLRSYSQLVDSQKDLEVQLHDAKRAAELLRDVDLQVSDGLQRLQRAQEQILQTERTNSLARMFEGIAHDINEGLMAILARTEFALKRADQLDPQARRDFSAIQDAADEMREEFQRFIIRHTSLSAFCTCLGYTITPYRFRNSHPMSFLTTVSSCFRSSKRFVISSFTPHPRSSSPMRSSP